MSTISFQMFSVFLSGREEGTLHNMQRCVIDNRLAVFLQGLSVRDTICELLGQRRATINFHCQAKTLFIVRMTNGFLRQTPKYSAFPLNGPTF